MNYRIATVLLTALVLLVVGCKSKEAYRPQGTLVVNASPPNGGTTTGSGTYQERDRVRITAAANVNWDFTRWDDDNTDASRVVTVRRGSKTYTASFVTTVANGNVIVTADPPAGGSVSGSGTYSVGQSIQIGATPAANWHFWHWQDFNLDNPRTVIVPAGTLIATANFVTNEVAQGTISATPTPNQGGSVSGTGSFPVGSKVTLTALPSSGWVFDKWQDGTTSTTHDFTVGAGNFVVTAYFAQLGTVGLVAEPINGGTTAGAGTYRAGQTITISATPATDFHFVQWQDGNSTPSRQVVVPAGTVIYSATFVAAGTGHCSVNWPAAENAASYLLSWGSNPGTKTWQIATNGLSARVTGLETNVTYYFSVQSVGSDGMQSEPGCEVSWRYGQANACGAF